MKINIVSPGRFHVCDLARELEQCGHDVRFYSYVPTKRAMKFGLPKQCSRSVVGMMLPLLILMKIFPKWKLLRRWRILFQDFVTGIYMQQCEVLIAMSGSFLYTVKVGKKAGAKVILERGSKHILEQKRILEAIPSLKGTKPVPDMNVKRELEGYDLADHIAIASNHVKESFLLHKYPSEKLFVNPYGVSLDQFYTDVDIAKEYDIIMVGAWSYRKGCDLLIDACRRMKVNFLHVGAIVDIDFPQEYNFTHFNSVDQKELVKFYNKAKVFVLPSREEGMAMVQMQAIACSLPVVCSKHTGGVDIGSITDLSEWIFEMQAYSIDDLCSNIQKALDFRDSNSYKTIKVEELSSLTWEAYGKRYSRFLNELK